MNSYYPSSVPRPKSNGDQNQTMIELDVFLCNRAIQYTPFRLSRKCLMYCMELWDHHERGT